MGGDVRHNVGSVMIDKCLTYAQGLFMSSWCLGNGPKEVHHHEEVPKLLSCFTKNSPCCLVARTL